MREPNQQDCFRAGTAARVGKKFEVCGITLLPKVGIPVELDWFCTPFCLTQRTPKSCGSAFLRLASLRPRMAAGLGIVVTGYQIRVPVLNTLIPRGPATVKSDIAS